MSRQCRNNWMYHVVMRRWYSIRCPPGPPASGCCPPGPPKMEHVCRPNIPPNPCMPYFPPVDEARKYRLLSILMLPVIAVMSFTILGHEPPPKGECRDYEYMRRRTKKFPWGDGVASFFHNEHVNHLPGECVKPPEDCDAAKKKKKPC